MFPLFSGWWYGVVLNIRVPNSLVITNAPPTPTSDLEQETFTPCSYTSIGGCVHQLWLLPGSAGFCCSTHLPIEVQAEGTTLIWAMPCSQKRTEEVFCARAPEASARAKFTSHPSAQCWRCWQCWGASTEGRLGVRYLVTVMTENLVLWLSWKFHEVPNL